MNMNTLSIDIETISRICQQHHVKRLHIFGSALTSKFTDLSDVDFLVKFENMDGSQYFKNYLSLKKNLSELLDRDIDLVEEQTLKNPYLLKSIERNKKLLYG
jgi:uncharacterized protein